MHTVELLEQALAAARQLGIRVRQEWIAGQGGMCEYRGKRWLFIDLGAPPVEQLHVVLEAIDRDPGLQRLSLSADLRNRLQVRRTA